MNTDARTTSSPAAQGPERSTRRDVLHLVVLVLPWTLFAWLWWRVALITTAAQLLTAVGLVLLAAVACLPVTLLWVAHNVRIFQRKGPRTARPMTPLDYRSDWTRRPVEADWEAVRASRTVIVEPDADRKSFRSGDPDHIVTSADGGPEDRAPVEVGR